MSLILNENLICGKEVCCLELDFRILAFSICMCLRYVMGLVVLYNAFGVFQEPLDFHFNVSYESP